MWIHWSLCRVKAFNERKTVLKGETSVEKVALGIKGMTCDHCVMTVTNALKAVPGVKAANVSLANNEAKVTYDGTVTTEENLKEAIREAGYQVG